ncbi:MAG: hypothetical protein V3W18_11785 [candidate division Zixibacteria bacterium]
MVSKLRVTTFVFAAILTLVIIANAQQRTYENSGGSGNLITSVPRTMTYQGILKDNAGDPVPNEVVNITFRIFNDPSAGDLMWDDALSISTDDGGYFMASLVNLNIPFDENYYLELQVEGESPMAPRIPLDMSAYAARSDTSDYAFAGGGWVDDGFTVRLQSSIDNVGIGTSSPSNKLHVVGSESVPILNVEQTGSFRAARFFSQNACALWVESAGNHGLRITNAGGNGVYVQNAGGDGINVANATGWAGYFNGTGYFAGNLGIGTETPAEMLDVAGNLLVSGKATIGPGHTNTGTSAFVAGQDNTASNQYATVGGGRNNAASGQYATVSGGEYNAANGDYSTVGGGTFNIVTGYFSTIAGGVENTVNGESHSIAGGNMNSISGPTGSFIGAGYSNNITVSNSFIGGGYDNTITGWDSFIGCGRLNSISGRQSSIPGGQFNAVAGNLSFAAGYRAKANHNGTFVWADQTDANFASTAADQFLIRASGGVGIGTTSPDYRLDVQGTVGIDVGSFSADIPLTIEVPSDHSALISRIAKGGNVINVVDGDGNVGIGTFTPAEKLDVVGTAQVTGLKMPTGASNGYVLTSDASGVGTWQAAAGGGIGGSGTANYVPKFTASTTLGNSMIYDDGSNVGIGTIAPNHTLEVGDGFGTRFIAINGQSGGMSGYKLLAAGTQKWFMGMPGISQLYFRNETNNDIMVLRQDGNVGIGTTTPNHTLEVGDGFGTRFIAVNGQSGGISGYKLMAGGSQKWFMGLPGISQLYFRNETNDDIMVLRQDGNVGIGTTTPDYKLDVQGSVGIDTRPYSGNIPLTIDVPADQDALISRIAKGGSVINVVDKDGQVGIGTFSPQGALDVSSTTGAFIVPRMTTTQRDALTAVNGMIIYNTTANQFNFRENGAWVTK